MAHGSSEASWQELAKMDMAMLSDEAITTVMR